MPNSPPLGIQRQVIFRVGKRTTSDAVGLDLDRQIGGEDFQCFADERLTGPFLQVLVAEIRQDLGRRRRNDGSRRCSARGVARSCVLREEFALHGSVAGGQLRRVAKV